MNNNYYDDDDGRVIADMSEVSRTPVLMPQLGNKKRDGQSAAHRSDMGPAEPRAYEREPEYISPENRRAMIGGALTAGLLIALVFALAFAGLIYFLGR